MLADGIAGRPNAATTLPVRQGPAWQRLTDHTVSQEQHVGYRGRMDGAVPASHRARPRGPGSGQRGRAAAALLVVAVATASCRADARVAAVGTVVSAPDDALSAALEHLSSVDTAPVATVPDLHGKGPGPAQAAVRSLGGRIHVVALDPTAAIARQEPAPGAPIAHGEVVTVWVGDAQLPAPDHDAPVSPGSPAPAAPAGDVAAAGERPAAVVVEDQPVAEGVPAPQPQPPPPPPGRPEPAGVAYPADRTPFPPAAGRVNPRLLPPLPTGTSLDGLASWYGPGFEGLRTACGTIYDSRQPVLASRELRCGTIVEVRGSDGRSVHAMAVDWGPAEWTGRRFDLSAATFAAIAHPGRGVTAVRVTVLAAPG